MAPLQMTLFGDTYRGRRVLVTGHTGFKGSWLSAWLVRLGATVAGYSDGVPTSPAHFDVAGIERKIKHYVGDVRDRARLAEVFDEFRPEIVFHLAAQALVRRSYADPVTTFEVNTMGPMNVLETVRHRPFVRTVVVITSDKCYRNVEWVWGYRESDHLGGDDPYSGSKGAAELVCYSYMRSYLTGDNDLAAVAKARAGNVIGGGD
jgi:CDP-glucose 4,6-dehydratase